MIDHNPDHLEQRRTRSWEYQLLDIYAEILKRGEHRADRTGTGTKAIFGANININLADGFPLLTTKRVPFKSVLSELLWFIEGSQDERRLAEILHGTRDPEKKTIWSPNAEGTTGASYTPKFDGDLGRVYGVQWRNWVHNEVISYDDYLNRYDGTNGTTYLGAKVEQTRIDQLADVVHKLKNKPTDRRIILSAWNPGELDQMALPPCHMFVQFYLSNDRKLHAQMYQRSVDVALGLPFNIASYALLTHMIAQVIEATPGMLTMVLGDTHIYQDHFDGVKEQLKREPSASLPRLRITRVAKDIDDFKMDDFELDNYTPQPAIKMSMSA